MSQENEDVGLSATSEVGSNRANEATPASRNTDEQWKLLFEMQNQQIQALVEVLKSNTSSDRMVILPEFNPDKRDSDARSWCSTADLCLEG